MRFNVRTKWNERTLATMEFTAGYACVASLAIQPDGRIVAGGLVAATPAYDFGIACYQADGSLDEDFGDGGHLRMDFDNAYDFDNALALDSQGRILAAGGTIANSEYNFTLRRCLPDGTFQTVGDRTTQYIWSPRYIDAPVLRNTFDAEGELQAEDRLYYLGDANYNITALVDPSGQVVERYVYSPYGMVTVCDAAFAPVAGNESTFANTVLYTGRALDLETGLDYYRARYYDAMMGRFVNRDPIEADLNLYRYCQSGPTNGTDPTCNAVLSSTAPGAPIAWNDPTLPAMVLFPLPIPPLPLSVSPSVTVVFSSKLEFPIGAPGMMAIRGEVPPLRRVASFRMAR